MLRYIRLIRQTRTATPMARQISLTSTWKPRPVPVPSIPTINLTLQEEQLCSLLDGCRVELLSQGIDVACRIAGGWVRDKLLDTESNDIDVALSTMTGVTFAEHFIPYVSSQGLPVKPVTKILQNPEQSKHLETARTSLLGIDLDFVNLRSEEYAADSRIPNEVKFGTALEDAMRRDITINALFYNVHTGQVEDFTSRGLEDLRNGYVQTPMEPLETFRDDPLRVLRCVRFASRFGFQIAPSIEHAACDPDIQTALVTKISRERVGEELDKMMRGPDPRLSAELIHRLKLYSPLFAVPKSIESTFSAFPTSHNLSLAAITTLHALLAPETIPELPPVHPLLKSQIALDKTLKPRIYLAALLTPYKGIQSVGKGKPKSAVEMVVREALKLGVQNHYVDGIPELFVSAENLSGLSLDDFPAERRRVDIGLLMRNKSLHNPNTGCHWTSSILFSLVQDLVKSWDSDSDNLDIYEASRIIKNYNDFTRVIEELELSAAADAKPILDGREVVSILSAKKSGQWTGQVLARVVEWQLGHPLGTKDQCVDWLRKEHENGNISTEDVRGHGPPLDHLSKKIKLTEKQR